MLESKNNIQMYYNNMNSLKKGNTAKEIIYVL